MKKFLITIDTEGDNLWAWRQGEKITTENTKYLMRFQELCERFGFIPTYLTNYEMACDDRFVSYFKEKREAGLCEIGMHLHAWNNPPEYALGNLYQGAPYLIEYPYEIMEKKIDVMTRRLSDAFGFTPTVHRAGRWAMNEDYFRLLDKYGYKVDCSVTPGVSFATSAGATTKAGPDYSSYPDDVYRIEKTDITEIPVSILPIHHMFMPHTLAPRKIAGAIKRFIKGENLWLRPNGHNLKQMKYMVKRARQDDKGYLMFMLHSSEFMPAGSPTFKCEEDIERLYSHLECIFQMVSKYYEGCTLEAYAKEYQGK